MVLMRFLAMLFLLSLGTYPVVEARIGSLPFPAIVLAVMLALVVAIGVSADRVLLSRQDRKIFAASTFLALWLALVTAASSAAFGSPADKHGYIGIGYILVFPALAVILRHIRATWLLSGLLAGCTIALAIGYIRFVTHSGGDPSEHALLYWGIRYLPSTRNSDVLYPVVSALIGNALYAIAPRPTVRLILLAIVIASFAAVIMSLSRSGWIALATGYAAQLWLGRHDRIATRRTTLAMSLVVVIGVLCAMWLNSHGISINYDVIVQRIHSFAETDDPAISNQARLDLASAALTAIIHNPFGVGVGNSGSALGLSATPAASAENAWLTLGLEGGWPALCAFSLILYWMFIPADGAWCRRYLRAKVQVSTIAPALLVALCSYMMFNYELNSLFLWSVMAIVMGLNRRRIIAIERHDIRSDGCVQRGDDGEYGVALDTGSDTPGG